MFWFFSFCVLCIISVGLSREETLGGFFGDTIQWKTYSEGYDDIVKTGKPGMVFFHRMYCEACHRLGLDVQQNTELIELSKQFVMISCNGMSEEPDSPAFEIDGTYVPRIFFINPNNTINYSMISNLYQYRYFYSNSRRLTEVMKDFLNRLEEDIDDEL